MGWERRARGGRYYTRSRRVSGQVVREYVGGGLAGELAARADARDRAARRSERDGLRGERKRLAAMDAELDALCEATDALARGALLLAGFHRHHRGEWRRRRGAEENEPPSDAGE